MITTVHTTCGFLSLLFGAYIFLTRKGTRRHILVGRLYCAALVTLNLTAFGIYRMFGTFIQGGINTINPVDVSAIRVPGAELREALLPEGMVTFSVGTSENTSLELLWLYDWGRTVIDPPGSYWIHQFRKRFHQHLDGVGWNKLRVPKGDIPSSRTLEMNILPGAFPTAPEVVAIGEDKIRRPSLEKTKRWQHIEDIKPPDIGA